MENGNFRQFSMPRLRGVRWASEHCVEKVEEMLSRAIVHQEDLLDLLTANCSLDAQTGYVMTLDTISPSVLHAVKAKVENSMDWCHLALCRLREIALHSSFSPCPSPSYSYSMGCSGWNPNNLLFSDPAPHLPLYTQPGEGSSSQQRHQLQQGQNFASLHTMDNSDWPLLLETGIPMSTDHRLSSPPNPSSADHLRQCSINPVVGSCTDVHYHNHDGVAENQTYINKTSNPMQRGNRYRNASGKSEVRKLNGGEAKLEVVFQKLNDAKKGIPDDGHRGWKKYGNKSIQNSNHCRGYYKCSIKECRAKKMVQPTDKDPTLFEVTYVGKHTCSSTGQRRSRSTRSAGCNPEAQGPSGQGKSPVAKDDDWKNKHGGVELEEGSILTGSNSMTEGSIGWSGIIPGSSTCKRGRSINDDKTNLDSYSYLHTMTTSTITTASGELRDQAGDAGDASMDTYLHQSSRHHQAVYSFQEPLLWHDFDMDTNLSTGHKSVSMDSDSP